MDNGVSKWESDSNLYVERVIITSEEDDTFLRDSNCISLDCYDNGLLLVLFAIYPDVMVSRTYQKEDVIC